MNISARKERLSRKLLGVSSAEIDAHFNMVPVDYFSLNTDGDILLHIKAINRFLHSVLDAEFQSSLNPTITWVDNLLTQQTEVTVVTWDRAGLFHKIVGSLSLSGFEIIKAKAVTRADHISIDKFCLGNATDKNNYESLELFEDYIEDSLVIGADLSKDIEFKRNVFDGYLAEDAMTPIILIGHEVKRSDALLTINASDDFALLYDISKTIYQSGFDVKNAKIETSNGVATDSFCIEKLHQSNNDISESLHELKLSLTKKISNRSLLLKAV